MYSRSGPTSSGPMQPPNAGNAKPNDQYQSYGGYGELLIEHINDFS